MDDPRGLCPPAEFARRVTFRTADMTAVPPDLAGFDFCWSTCAVEHVGSLDRSKRFILDMVQTLRPGGVGVHTTEFNVEHDTETLLDGPTVIWRACDLREVGEQLRRGCHRLADLDLSPGDGPADRVVDEPPYRWDPHLKLRLNKYVTTSVGLIVERDGWRRRGVWERALSRGRKLLGR